MVAVDVALICINTAANHSGVSSLAYVHIRRVRGMQWWSGGARLVLGGFYELLLLQIPLPWVLLLIWLVLVLILHLLLCFVVDMMYTRDRSGISTYCRIIHGLE